MKTRWETLVIVLTVAPIFAVSKAAAHSEFAVRISINEVSDFYQPLGAYGYWVDRAPYGRCWYPAYVRSDWRPYSEGRWVWTDDCGWYWVSSEPWAWACYHYGRWVWDSHYGWIWVPGTEWGPSWVSWCDGGDYVGWAPLPPECDFGPRGVIAVNFVIAPRAFVFVERRHFCEQIRPYAVVVNQTIINQTIINKTKHFTNIRRENGRVFVGGPDQHAIELGSGEKVRTDIAANLWHKRSERVMQRATVERVSAPPVTPGFRPTQQNRPPEIESHEAARPRVQIIRPTPSPAAVQPPAPSAVPRSAPAPVAEHQHPRDRQARQQEQPVVVEPPVRNRGNLFDGRTIEGYRRPPPPEVSMQNDRKQRGDDAGDAQRDGWRGRGGDDRSGRDR